MGIGEGEWRVDVGSRQLTFVAFECLSRPKEWTIVSPKFAQDKSAVQHRREVSRTVYVTYNLEHICSNAEEVQKQGIIERCTLRNNHDWETTAGIIREIWDVSV